jgi:hypothetical protein
MQTNRRRGLEKHISELRLRLVNADRVAQAPSAPVSDVDSNEKIRRRAWETYDVIRTVAHCFRNRRRGRRDAQDKDRRNWRATAPRLAHACERRSAAGRFDENDVCVDVWEKWEIRLATIPRHAG